MKLKLIGFGVILLMFSCKTYTVTPESFKTQFTQINDSVRKQVEINNPLFYSKIKYLSNNVKYLNVYDKKGNIFFMQNSPSLEMRVTLSNGKRKIVYFDTVSLENDTLRGGKSRFIPGLTSVIPFNQIIKIELQEGGKNYYYQNQF